jgi:deazaflavin-dependent oxidoreductase (nitroreductase family)
MGNEEIHDSPNPRIAQHIQRYVDSDGQNGHDWYGGHALLLTTRGRRSGLLRRTPVAYTKDGENYIIIASNAGSDHHPIWYLNLLADPEAQVQAGADSFTATAHVIEGEEKARLWAQMTAVMPGFNKYQQGTERQIPLVVLVPKRNSQGRLERA